MKRRIDLTLNKDLIPKLKSYCILHNKSCSELVNQLVSDRVENGVDLNTKQQLNQIVRDLRMPIAYIKTPKGIIHAKKERRRRNEIAAKIERLLL